MIFAGLMTAAPPVPPVLHRWKLTFSTPYGSTYRCEVEASTALAAVTAALRHGADRPGASTMFFATSIIVQQADNPN